MLADPAAAATGFAPLAAQQHTVCTLLAHRRAALYLAMHAACTQVATLAPFASCAALIELFLRSNAIGDLEEVAHTHTHR